MQSKHSPVWVVMHYSYRKYNHIVELKKTHRPDLLFSTSCITQHIRIHTHVFQYDIYSFLFTSVQLVMVLSKSLIMVMQFFFFHGMFWGKIYEHSNHWQAMGHQVNCWKVFNSARDCHQRVWAGGENSWGLNSVQELRTFNFQRFI